MWTRRDRLLARVLRYVQHRWPIQSDEDLKPYWTRKLELSSEAGCLVWCGRVVDPPQGRESVVIELHAGHPGVSRMKSLARGLVLWPGLDTDIENAVKQCLCCINQFHRQLHFNHGVGRQGPGLAYTSTMLVH